MAKLMWSPGGSRNRKHTADLRRRVRRALVRYMEPSSAITRTRRDYRPEDPPMKPVPSVDDEKPIRMMTVSGITAAPATAHRPSGLQRASTEMAGVMAPSP